MLKNRLFAAMVAVFLSLTLVACGGGDDGGGPGTGGGGNGNTPVSVTLTPSVIDDASRGQHLTIEGKASGFDGALTARITDGKCTPVRPGICPSAELYVSDNQLGERLQELEITADEPFKLHLTVNSDAAVGQVYELNVTVGEGESAAKAPLKVTVADTVAPKLTINFPPDRSVISADRVSVTGHVEDDGEVESITVNGVPTNLDPATGQWELAEAALANIGGNDLVIEAVDKAGKTTQQVLDIFRYNDAATYAQAFDEDYLGNLSLPNNDEEPAYVDAVTGKVYLGHEDGGGFTVVEIDPDTGHGREILKNAKTGAGDDLLSYDYPMAVHDGVAYFYVLDALDPTPAGDDDDYDGIYRAVLSDCTGTVGDLSCVQPFALNGVGASDADTIVFYDLNVNLMIQGDELWVFNVGDTNSGIEDGGLVKVSLTDGSFIGAPKAIDAGDNDELVLQGDYLYDMNFSATRYDISATDTDPTETPFSRCDDSGLAVASSNCPADFPSAIGAGPSLLAYWDVAPMADNAVFALAQSATRDGGGAFQTFNGFYAVDLASGDRNFLLGRHFDTGLQVSRGEDLPNLGTVKLIQDAQRQRLYIWDGPVVFAVNVAKVKDMATGELRYALDTVRVGEEP